MRCVICSVNIISARVIFLKETEVLPASSVLSVEISHGVCIVILSCVYLHPPTVVCQSSFL